MGDEPPAPALCPPQFWMLTLATTLPLPAGYFMPIFIYGELGGGGHPAPGCIWSRGAQGGCMEPWGEVRGVHLERFWGGGYLAPLGVHPALGCIWFWGRAAGASLWGGGEGG